MCLAFFCLALLYLWSFCVFFPCLSPYLTLCHDLVTHLFFVTLFAPYQAPLILPRPLLYPFSLPCISSLPFAFQDVSYALPPVVPFDFPISCLFSYSFTIRPYSFALPLRSFVLFLFCYPFVQPITFCRDLCPCCASVSFLLPSRASLSLALLVSLCVFHFTLSSPLSFSFSLSSFALHYDMWLTLCPHLSTF